ncbi:MAG: hypothetical protein WDA75_01715 [Candidatus Latescibacterota bacterium]|jgi:hypothetical protein
MSCDRASGWLRVVGEGAVLGLAGVLLAGAGAAISLAVRWLLQ